MHIIKDKEDHYTKFLTLRWSEKCRSFSDLFGKLNPVHDTGFFLYPLKTSDILVFSVGKELDFQS